jgi:hypothetical protein
VFAVVLNVPPRQTAHSRSVVAEPGRVTRVPGPHAVLGTHWVAGSASLSHCSLAQGTASVLPPAQYSPGLQGVQAWAAVDVPGAVSTVPAGQSFGLRQKDWFTPLVYVPAPQGEQSRSVVAEGGLAT